MYVYKQIDSIVFGLFSSRFIKKMASVKIVTPELYDKEGYPVDGGLMDVRLGVIDPGLRCKTCGGKIKECNGHFGYIDLARPVIHVLYVSKILNFLRSTCNECGELLCDDKKKISQLNILKILDKENRVELKRKQTRKFIAALKTVKKCPHCKAKQNEIKLEKPTTFYEADKRLSPIDINIRLERINDENVVLLGLNPDFARPEWMVLTILPIPPVTMRPSITLESGERSEDDLTHKLGDVVRINQRLFENINAGAPEIIIEDLWDLLQYHVTTFFDNTVPNVPPARHRSGSTLKTLVERIKSKEGRFRYNLAGKRVNFSARTVISPDPKIGFDEVGVPEQIAIKLTVPERVTDWNIEWLKKFIENGPDKYPGANYIVRTDGKKKKITDETREQLLDELENGSIVERHLIDGDISIFNRQPSLHRMSIMCHRIRILSGKSFRLNPAVCHPYNADFDGDEMNLHIPQNEEARAEAEILMQVQTQIITPKNGVNIIGCVEDSVSGTYLLTKDMSLDKEKAIQLLFSIGIESIPEFKSKVNGKEIFSVLLPKDLNFIGRNKSNEQVIIKNGKLVSGVVDENIIGEENGALIKELHRAYNKKYTLSLMSNIFKLGIEVLLLRGFTTGISDTDLPEDVVSKMKQLKDEARVKVKELVSKYRGGKLEAYPGKTVKETLEVMILEVLNDVRNRVGNIIAENVKDNFTIVMLKSGARGNILNLAQMAACVGQQSLRGQRIGDGYTDRTLSIFKKHTLGVNARGFIEHGFKEGLNPAEFFFGAMTGRDSLMDTALRTPKSGYLYRRLANALQDLKVEYDYTVRDANKKIIQFKYGEDGIDVSKSENGTINIKKIIERVKHD